MKDVRAKAVACRNEQGRMRMQVGLGLLLGILLVQGVVAMTSPGEQAIEVAALHDRMAMGEWSAR